MKVLLTGGHGFIGTHVWERLEARGHDVVALDSLRPDVHRPGSPHRDDLVVGDVRDGSTLDRVLPGVDVVCHLAAKVGLGVDVQDLPDYADTNVHGTAAVLAAMSRAEVGRIVVASSMVVYGEGLGRCADHGVVVPGQRAEAELRAGRFEPPCPICAAPLAPHTVGEHAALDPRNAYAASKVAQEHLTSAWVRSTGGAAAMLRYHNVYGPGMPRDTPYAGVAAIFRSALAHGRAPQVYEDGGQRRDFVHVRDVAAATVAAIERHDRGVAAFNVGSGSPRTVGDLASALAEAARGPRPQITGAYRLGDVRHITADSSRIRDALGWAPTVGFDAGVAELMG